MKAAVLGLAPTMALGLPALA